MISELLAKYKEARVVLEAHEKKVERYRKKIEAQMATQGLDHYTDGQWIVRKQVQQRMMFAKKHVPETIWKQYAKPQTVEFVSIREAPKPSQKKT